MLMALLPLAGFAEGFDNASVKFGKFTYGDTKIPAEQVTDEILLEKGTHYTVDDKVYKENTFKTTVAFNEMQAGKSYYVKIFGKPGSVYEGYETYGTIDVKQAPLTLRVNSGTNLEKAYRAADPDATKLAYVVKNAAQLLNGDDAKDLKDIVKGTLAYTYKGQPNAGVGSIDLTFSGLTADNYEIDYEALKIVIAQKNIADVTIEVNQSDVVYTGKNITPVYTLKDGDYTLQVGAKKDYTVTIAEGDVKNVGTYTPTIATSGTTNYYGSIVVGDDLKKFNVTKATLSVAAQNTEKTYKAADYTIADCVQDVVFYGLLGDDADNVKKSSDLAGYVAPNFALQGTKAKNAGNYAITLTNGSSDNYNFLLQNEGALAGKLTINPAELTVTADDKSRGLGQANPKFTYTPTGMQGSEEAKDIITTEPTLTCAATESSEGGEYPIVISGGTVNSNYKLVYVNGTLTVGKVAITLTLLPDSKVYGDDDPDYLGAEGTPVEGKNYVVNGLLEGDKLTNLHITRAEGEAFGKYLMSATFDAVDATKYKSVSVAPAQFSVTARPLTVKVMPQTLANGAAVGALVVSDETVVVEGLKFEDKVTDVVVLSFNDDGINDVATYGTTDIDYPGGIVASLKGGVKNYTFENVTGRLVFGKGSDDILLSDADATNLETIKLYDKQKKNVVINFSQRNAQKLPATAGANRIWDAKQWNTLVLPFDISVAQLSLAFEYAIVNVVDPSKTTANNVQFKLEMDEIPANTPFTIKTSKKLIGADDKEGITVAGDPNEGLIDFSILGLGTQTILAPTDAQLAGVDAGMGYKFVPTYEKVTVDKDKSALRFLLGNSNSWAKIGATSEATWDIVPFAAYVDLSASAAPEMVTFTFQELDGSTTTVKAIESGLAKANGYTMEGWYNLNGVKLEGAPTQKGIYINNGRKVVIK